MTCEEEPSNRVSCFILCVIFYIKLLKYFPRLITQASIIAVIMRRQQMPARARTLFVFQFAEHGTDGQSWGRTLIGQ